MKSIVVFASGAGSTFEYIVNQRGEDYIVSHLFTDRKNAGCKELANSLSIPVVRVNHDGKWKITLKEIQPDLIVLAGYLKQMDEDIVEEFSGRIINTHPALLPLYGGKGMYGMNVHCKVVEDGRNITGVTIHYVSNEYDKGEIIAQEKIPIRPDDTPLDVSQKVQSIEKPLLVKVIKEMLGGINESAY